MTVNETIAARRTAQTDDAPEPYSAAWWESRTAEELRDIINRGFAGGQALEAAVAETERRARQETRRLRELAAAEALLRRKRMVIVLGLSATALALAALIGAWLAS